MTELLVILLECLRSLLYESMVKRKIPENWAEKPPPRNSDIWCQLLAIWCQTALPLSLYKELNQATTISWCLDSKEVTSSGL